MRSLLTTLYTQRRRLFVGVVWGWAFLLSNSGLVFYDTPAPIIVATLLIMAVIFVAAMMLFITIVPSMRNVIEVLAVSAAANYAASHAVPGLFEIGVTFGLPALICFALFLLVYFSMYGTLLDGLPAWFSYTGRAQFRTKASAQAIFATFIPAEGHNSSYRSGTLQYLGPDADDPDSYNVRYAVGEGLFEQQKITPLEEFDPPHRARYYFIGDVTARNAAFAEGIFDLSVTETEGGTHRQVHIIEEHPALRLCMALALWFDDHVADTAASGRARAEGKRDLSLSGRFWRKQAKLV